MHHRVRILLFLLGLGGVAVILWLTVTGGSPGGAGTHGDQIAREEGNLDQDQNLLSEKADSATNEGASFRKSVDEGMRFEFRLDSEPASNTEFFILPWSEAIRERAWSLEGLSKSLIERESEPYESDASGIASLEMVTLPFFLAARAPGSAPFGKLFEAAPDGSPIDLSHEEHLYGRVVTGMERAVVDAQVVARRGFEDEYNTDGVREDDQRVAGMFFESVVRTDPDGSFEIGGLPAARVQVMARAPGEASHVHAEFALPMSEPIELVLRSSVDISGLVLAESDGRPIEGARVAAIIPLRGGRLTETTVASSDDAGGFELKGVPAGAESYRVRVVRSGYAALLSSVSHESLVKGVTPILRLKDACEARGETRSATGEAVSGAWVQVHDSESGALMHFTRSNPEGGFTIDFAEAGRPYRLIVVADGYYPVELGPRDLCSSEDLDIVLERKTTFEGRVVVDDLPLRNAQARLVMEDEVGNRLGVQETDVDPETGEFGFAGLDAGTYVLDAWAPEYAPARIKNVPVGQEPSGDAVEIRLDRGGTLRGTVTERATGRPIVGAAVTLGDRCVTGHSVGSLPGASSVMTDGNGAYILEHVPSEAPQALLVEHTGYSSESRDVLLPAQAHDGIMNVALSRACSILVWIRDEEGRRFRSFWALALTATEERQPESGLDHSAVKTFEGLPAGKTII
ncbi:MAG: carboxypeptidase-like regulatory domain-containing protein, partial [Planctomycetota bacterium]